MAATADFRTRAAQLAAQARNVTPGSVDVAGTAKGARDATEPLQAQMAQRSDDAYARRAVGGPIAAAASQDASLKAAANRRYLDRKAAIQALEQRRAGIAASWGAQSAQEQVMEAIRRLEEEKRKRQAKLWADLAGAAGMIVGTAVGGPAGGAAGGALGRSAGGSLGGG